MKSNFFDIIKIIINNISVKDIVNIDVAIIVIIIIIIIVTIITTIDVTTATIIYVILKITITFNIFNNIDIRFIISST